MRKKQILPFTEEWMLYEKGKEYNYSINLYETVNTNERFFRGDQWDNLNSGGLPTPVFNIFKRIIGYFTSSIMQSPVTVRENHFEYLLLQQTAAQISKLMPI